MATDAVAKGDSMMGLLIQFNIGKYVAAFKGGFEVGKFEEDSDSDEEVIEVPFATGFQPNAILAESDDVD